jgi:hypothetical protein
MKEIRQCPSCGGICRKSGCERADLDRDFSDHALKSAVYWQNRYCDLLEIIEMFCMDAEEQHRPWMPPATIVLTEPKPDFLG